MRVEAAALAGASQPKVETPAEATDRSRKEAMEGMAAAAEQKKQTKAVQPEEILDKIKTLTQDGAFSVRFEMHPKTGQFVARLVDAESGEVIRQLPPEEMLELSAKLEELRGNIVNAKS
jgi:flagellar protein FlaG